MVNFDVISLLSLASARYLLRLISQCRSPDGAISSVSFESIKNILAFISCSGFIKLQSNIKLSVSVKSLISTLRHLILVQNRLHMMLLVLVIGISIIICYESLATETGQYWLRRHFGFSGDFRYQHANRVVNTLIHRSKIARSACSCHLHRNTVRYNSRELSLPLIYQIAWHAKIGDDKYRYRLSLRRPRRY